VVRDVALRAGRRIILGDAAKRAGHRFAYGQALVPPPGRQVEKEQVQDVLQAAVEREQVLADIGFAKNQCRICQKAADSAPAEDGHGDCGLRIGAVGFYVAVGKANSEAADKHQPLEDRAKKTPHQIPGPTVVVGLTQAERFGYRRSPSRVWGRCPRHARACFA
jgi:hypothetical protein